MFIYISRLKLYIDLNSVAHVNKPYVRSKQVVFGLSLYSYDRIFSPEKLEKRVCLPKGERKKCKQNQ